MKIKIADVLNFLRQDNKPVTNPGPVRALNYYHLDGHKIQEVSRTTVFSE
jgi:hypothetical protein